MFFPVYFIARLYMFLSIRFIYTLFDAVSGFHDCVIFIFNIYIYKYYALYLRAARSLKSNRLLTIEKSIFTRIVVQSFFSLMIIIFFQDDLDYWTYINITYAYFYNIVGYLVPIPILVLKRLKIMYIMLCTKGYIGTYNFIA